jgi:hypothetical protein
MEYLTTRQIVMFVIVLLIGGALTAWATVFLVQKYVAEDPNDPLARQGGLSPAQSIQKTR